MMREKRLEHFVEGEDEDYREYKKLAHQIPKYSHVFNRISLDSQRHASYFRALLLGETITDFPEPPKRIRVPQPPKGNGEWDERMREEIAAIKVYLAFAEEEKEYKPILRSIVADELTHLSFLKSIKEGKDIKLPPRKNPIDWAMLGASLAGSVIATLIATALISYSIKNNGKKSIFHRGDIIERVTKKLGGRKKNPPIDWELTGSIGRMVAQKGNKKVVVTKPKGGPFKFKFYSGNKKLVDAEKSDIKDVVELTTSLVTKDPDKVFSSIEKVYEGEPIRNFMLFAPFIMKKNPPFNYQREYYTHDSDSLKKGDIVYIDVNKAHSFGELVPAPNHPEEGVWGPGLFVEKTLENNDKTYLRISDLDGNTLPGYSFDARYVFSIPDEIPEEEIDEGKDEGDVEELGYLDVQWNPKGELRGFSIVNDKDNTYGYGFWVKKEEIARLFSHIKYQIFLLSIDDVEVGVYYRVSGGEDDVYYSGTKLKCLMKEIMDVDNTKDFFVAVPIYTSPLIIMSRHSHKHMFGVLAPRTGNFDVSTPTGTWWVDGEPSKIKSINDIKARPLKYPPDFTENMIDVIEGYNWEISKEEEMEIVDGIYYIFVSMDGENVAWNLKYTHGGATTSYINTSELKEVCRFVHSKLKEEPKESTWVNFEEPEEEIDEGDVEEMGYLDVEWNPKNRSSFIMMGKVIHTGELKSRIRYGYSQVWLTIALPDGTTAGGNLYIDDLKNYQPIRPIPKRGEYVRFETRTIKWDISKKYNNAYIRFESITFKRKYEVIQPPTAQEWWVQYFNIELKIGQPPQSTGGNYPDHNTIMKMVGTLPPISFEEGIKRLKKGWRLSDSSNPFDMSNRIYYDNIDDLVSADSVVYIDTRRAKLIEPTEETPEPNYPDGIWGPGMIKHRTGSFVSICDLVAGECMSEETHLPQNGLFNYRYIFTLRPLADGTPAPIPPHELEPEPEPEPEPEEEFDEGEVEEIGYLDVQWNPKKYPNNNYRIFRKVWRER